MNWRPGALGLILLGATCITQPVWGQLVGTRTVEATNCASAVGGDVRDSTITTVCGMLPEQVVELVRLAASPQAGDRAELLVRLSALVPASSELRVEAIVKFFRLLGEVPVEENQLADRFAQIAEEHRRLAEDVKSLRVNDPEVQALRQQAAAAVEAADHTRARAKLEEARAIVRTKRETLARVLADQRREEAGLVFEQARVERARLAYDEAARLFREATDLLPAADIETRWRYTLNEGSAWFAKGDRFGDNHALEQAVGVDRAALQLASRSERPLDWARTQGAVGVALRELGDREGGTARLEEAVATFRLALEEITRERSSLEWAGTQNNLGIALRVLARRETGTAHLEEAIAAHHLALEVFTRERLPAAWAITQENLGRALVDLGRRETGTARLEEAVLAIRLALQERTRERDPLGWARTQEYLGSALEWLGRRETGTAHLEEAVAAYRLALEVEAATRERWPVQWAIVQNNLGHVLEALGERETGTAHLEETIAAYRLALGFSTRERLPAYWAITQDNLGRALLALGRRESGTARLEEAIAADRLALEERTRERDPLAWDHPGQPRHCTQDARRARDRNRAPRRGHHGLPSSAGGKDARAGAARLGADTEQSWLSPCCTREARERNRAPRGGHRGL